MSLTLLLIGGSTLAVAAAYMMTSGSAIHSALAAPTGTGGQNTVVGLGDSGAETLASGTRTKARTDWQLATVDDLTAAEELLDCLENQGFAERELVVLGNSSFAVRWR